MTLHRPSNVDDGDCCRVSSKPSPKLPSRNADRLSDPSAHPQDGRQIRLRSSYFNSGDTVEGIWLTEPLGYLEFLHLNMNARVVLTDSGGLQEETRRCFGVPCITLRHNTERPITCTEGTNQLVGNDKDRILKRYVGSSMARSRARAFQRSGMVRLRRGLSRS